MALLKERTGERILSHVVSENLVSPHLTTLPLF